MAERFGSRISIREWKYGEQNMPGVADVGNAYAEKARAQGIALATFIRMLKDTARGGEEGGT
jgi:hypothetical protein